jgi:phage terminase large subunit-like protein
MPANNLIAHIAKDFMSGNTEEVVDIVTFVESPWGLGINLMPSQRFMLKCFYGMELDNTDKCIEIPDILNEKVLYKFTEKGFLDFLYAEGRCNTEHVEGVNFHELVLVLGRRGTKSTMASCISNYELYKLVKRGDPSRFFGFPPNTIISILNVAPTDDQAGQVFDMIQNMALKCPYLRDRSLHQTMTYFDIQTDADMKLHGKPRASLVSVAGGCSSNSLRGRNAIVVIMDEMAFFIDKENSRFSGGEVYKALTPSMTDFGEHGKVLCLSSPYGKFGRFYERFQESFEEPGYTLMFKMYTAMSNPRAPSEILRAAYRRDRTGFMSEYGGEFSDRVTAWIESEHEFRKNVHDRPVVTKGQREIQYFIGIDLGFKKDGAAIAIVHKEGNKIVLDYADVWFASESDVWDMQESIYHSCTKYKHKPILKMADIVKEVKELNRWFPIKSGLFDQAGGWGFQELLTVEGFKQIEMKHFTDTINNDIYQLAKRLYGEQLLDIYEHPVLVPEMLSLEAEKKAKGKIIVEAPNRDGAHDDISDAFVRAIWTCYNASAKRPSHIATGAGGQVGVVGKLKKNPVVQQPQMQTQQQAMLAKRKKHGEHPRGLDRLKRRRPGAVRR